MKLISNDLTRKYVKNRKGASALEFAILAPLFFLLLISMLEVGFHSLVQSDLDSLTYNFTLEMSITEDFGVEQSAIVDRMICSQPTVIIRCDKITAGVDAYDRFTFFDNEINNSFVDIWKTGCGGATIVTELNYPTQSFILPFIFGDIILKNGEQVHRSRGLIKREAGLIGNDEGSMGTGSSGLPC